MSTEYVDVMFAVTGDRLTDDERESLAIAFEAWCTAVGREPVTMATNPRALAERSCRNALELATAPSATVPVYEARTCDATSPALGLPCALERGHGAQHRWRKVTWGDHHTAPSETEEGR